MAKTLSIAGVSYPDVPHVDFNLTSGGTTRYYDCVGSTDISQNGHYDVTGLSSVDVNVNSGGGTPRLWLGGDNPVLVSEINEFYSLDSVGFTTSGVSTTSKTLMSAVTYAGISLPDIVTKDYVAIAEASWVHSYTTEPSSLAHQVGISTVAGYSFVSRNNTNGTLNYRQLMTILPAHTLNKYLNNKSVIYYGTATGYGIGGVIAAPTLSSTSATNPTVTFKSPTITVRTSTTYMASSAWSYINSATSGLRYVVRVYAVDQGTSSSGRGYNQVLNIIGNPNWYND